MVISTWIEVCWLERRRKKPFVIVSSVGERATSLNTHGPLRPIHTPTARLLLALILAIFHTSTYYFRHLLFPILSDVIYFFRNVTFHSSFFIANSFFNISLFYFFLFNAFFFLPHSDSFLTTETLSEYLAESLPPAKQKKNLAFHLSQPPKSTNHYRLPSLASCSLSIRNLMISFLKLLLVCLDHCLILWFGYAKDPYTVCNKFYDGERNCRITVPILFSLDTYTFISVLKLRWCYTGYKTPRYIYN